MTWRILLVEDSTAQARFIQQTLSDLPPPTHAEVIWAEGLAAALDRLDDSEVDLVLLDLVLPDSEGLATFTAVQASHAEVPIIVLSGSGDDSVALEAVSLGAQDFLAKNSLSPELLTRSIRYALERHRALEHLRRVALLDELTGLYNRRGFMFLAEQHLAVARRLNTPVTVLFADVDGLKRVNDTYGHQEGDRLISDMAELLRTTLRNSDIVGRVGGDEFCAMLVNDGSDPPGAIVRLKQAMLDHNALGSRPLPLSCSIGAFTHQPSATATVAELMTRADTAMYEDRLATRRPLVLVVDDDPTARLIAERILAGTFEVITAASGREAIELARRHLPAVILLDLGLGDMTGGDVVGELRSRPETASVPVVIVTGTNDDSTELIAFRAGCAGFVVKPVDPADLRQVMARAIGPVSQSR